MRMVRAYALPVLYSRRLSLPDLHTAPTRSYTKNSHNTPPHGGLSGKKAPTS